VAVIDVPDPQVAPAHASSHPVPRQAFVNAMARAVTGVSVVATDGPAGRFALTVSAVASVSAEPPLLLACISRCNPLRAALLGNGVFTISLLAAGQAEVADVCAGRGPGRPFDVDAIAWGSGRGGLPVVAGSSAVFECVLETAHEAGSHTIVIGRVVEAAAVDAAPLLYSQRRYGHPELCAA